jgi:predicted permease
MATTAISAWSTAVVIDPFRTTTWGALASVRVRDLGSPRGRTYYTPDEFLEIAERSAIFDGVMASTISDVLWTGQQEPQSLRGNYVTTNTFQVLGVPPLLGRAITPADGAPGVPDVAVLGYRFWQRQFGGDRSVIGRELLLNGKVRTVIGIMPQRFMWRGADVYLPIAFERGRTIEGVRFVHLLGRLRPGVTEARAEVDLRPIIEDLQKRTPGQFPERWRVGLLSFKETFAPYEALDASGAVRCCPDRVRRVSNLLLSKAASRREAVGGALVPTAAAWSVSSSPSLLLASWAARSGWLAFGASRLSPSSPRTDRMRRSVINGVLWFSVAVSILTALLFSWPRPAARPRTWRGARRRRGQRRGGAETRHALVVTGVALSLMLSSGRASWCALMLLQALTWASDRPCADDAGAAGQRLSDAPAGAPSTAPASHRRCTGRGFGRIEHGAASHRRLADAGRGRRQRSSGRTHRPRPPGQSRLPAGHGNTAAAGPDVRRGRDHERPAPRAGERRLRPALLGRAGRARTHRSHSAPTTAAVRAEGRRFQVVGVVRDTLNPAFMDEVWPEISVPYDPAERISWRYSLASIEPRWQRGRSRVYSVDRPAGDGRARDRGGAGRGGSAQFNLVLLGLRGSGPRPAVIGVYGVMSNSVAQQTQEIGVRIALGAGLGDIARMVLGRGLKLLGGGILLGLAGSLAGARLLAGQVWRLSPFDPVSFAVVSLLLLVVGVQACFWPARRAARIDAVTALREE